MTGAAITGVSSVLSSFDLLQNIHEFRVNDAEKSQHEHHVQFRLGSFESRNDGTSKSNLERHPKSESKDGATYNKMHTHAKTSPADLLP